MPTVFRMSYWIFDRLLLFYFDLGTNLEMKLLFNSFIIAWELPESIYSIIWNAIFKKLAFIYIKIDHIFSWYTHGTAKPTGITCVKISYYMHDSACGWLIVENDKIFWSYVKIFPLEVNCRNMIGSCKYVFMNHSIIFLDRDNKTKFGSFFFLLFRKF